MQDKSCPGCGALILAGGRINHLSGCVSDPLRARELIDAAPTPSPQSTESTWVLGDPLASVRVDPGRQCARSGCSNEVPTPDHVYCGAACTAIAEEGEIEHVRPENASAESVAHVASVIEAAIPTFQTKDSGAREEFTTGAKRDTQVGKGRFDRLPWLWVHELAKAMESPQGESGELRLDLVPVEPLSRIACLFGRGAAKYGAHNYQKGMPLSRFFSSMTRHAAQWAEGDKSEDHLAAVAWNAIAAMVVEKLILDGALPQEMLDYGPHSVK